MTGNRPVRNGPGQKSRLKITNAQNYTRYVALGRTLFLAKSPDHDEELRNVNRKNNGHPFLYPELLTLPLATIRNFCGLSSEVLSIGALGEDSAPSFSQIRKRMKSIKLSTNNGMIRAQCKEGVSNPAIDGTGLSPTARSEYIRFKHKVRHGFIRLTLIDTREILGFSVIDDTVEAPQFESLTCMALENAGLDAGIQDSKGRGTNQSVVYSSDSCRTQKIVMRADGVFDSRRIFETCKRLDIIPYIRINHNATTRSGGVSMDRTVPSVGDHAPASSSHRISAHQLWPKPPR